MKENRSNSEDIRKPLIKAGTVALIGLEMGISIGIGFAIGYILDKKFNTTPYLTLTFFILGVIAAFRLLYQRAKQVK